MSKKISDKNRSIYAIVYNHPKTGSLKGHYKEIDVTNDFREEIVKDSSWRFDVTDDPSFYCHSKGKGPLTWGICRPDVRTKLAKGDVVVFICYDADDKGYYLSCIATVSDKIRQTDIWTDPKFSHFRGYYNIIIKKTESGDWVHEEPLPKGKNVHCNWDKKILEKIPKHYFTFSNNIIYPGYEVIPNYILFSDSVDKTYILDNQIILAKYDKIKDKKKEIWVGTKESNKIQDFIFKHHDTRISLKVHEKNQSHVKLRISLDEDEMVRWRSEFINYLKSVDHK